MTAPLLHRLESAEISALLERLLAIADDAIIVADDAQRIVLFNEGAERIFGHRAADIIGQPLALLVPEPLREGHDWLLREFARSPQAARRMADRRDIQGRRADGSCFDADASIAHVDLDGHTYFAAILRDVSASRRAARALADSEAIFRELAATAPVGIFTTDLHGRFLYANERWSEIAGMTADEAQGQGWLRALHPADRDAVRDALHSAIAAGAPFQRRFRFLRSDGTETWVIGNAVASRGAEGAAHGYLATITDVTQSQRQAIELERAKADAEAAVRAKSLFLANMSHEIRTPLNAVIGMTSLLLDTPMPEEQREYARTIRSSSESLLEIINDILDYSKSEVGKLEIEQLAFDLRAVIEESLDLMAPRAAEKALNLAYIIQDGTPEALVGDASRLRQILINLLSNAVKFTHQGEVFVEVESTALDTRRHELHIAVHDSGIGIAAEHLPRLFQSFSQVDASTTRKFGGTGLGLAITKRLAELMGGFVVVTSRPGEGSIFHVTVRVESRDPDSSAEFLQRNVPALAGKRLLIVDPYLTNRRIFTQLALLWGMAPITYPSALEALDRIRRGERYDLALLDAGSHAMEGIELASAIRRYCQPGELPIVMLASLRQRQTLAGHESRDIAAFLSKPIKARELFTTLQRVVQGCAATAMDALPAALAPRLAQMLPLRVLVAEDNIVNQRVIVHLLEHLGYRADLVANGLEVLDAVERQPYDVILMDVQMPEMDGLQAAQWIAQRRTRAGTPRIIAMTANAMPGDREAYMRAGMDAYLPKPVELSSLAAALRQASAEPRALAPKATSVEPGLRTPSGGTVIDHGRLEHLRLLQDGGQSTLVRDLIDLFRSDAPAQLDGLRRAADDRDCRRLRELAHRFLSTTQNIGAVTLAGMCVELERLAHLNQLEPSRELLEQIAREHGQVQAELATARQGY